MEALASWIVGGRNRPGRLPLPVRVTVAAAPLAPPALPEAPLSLRAMGFACSCSCSTSSTT